MDDALLVRGSQCFGDGHANLQDPIDPKTFHGNQAVQGLALDQLHGQEVDVIRLLYRVHGDDTGVVERGERLRFTLEALEPLLARSHLGRQHLDSHLTPELGVLGTVDLAHTAFTQLGDDRVVRQLLTDHVWRAIVLAIVVSGRRPCRPGWVGTRTCGRRGCGLSSGMV